MAASQGKQVAGEDSRTQQEIIVSQDLADETRAKMAENI